LAQPIQTLVFTYYDSNLDIATQPDEVRFVEISLTVTDQEEKVEPVTLTSRVSIRKEVFVYTLVISEINYDPPNSNNNEERYREWVELFNYGVADIDLTGWAISNTDGTDTLQPGGADMILGGGEYAIITTDPTYVFSDYTVDSGALHLHVNRQIGAGKLDNDFDTVTIRDSAGNMVDSVPYESTWGGSNPGGPPWTWNTIERIDHLGPSDQASNWEDSSVVDTYTAGSENTVTP